MNALAIRADTFRFTLMLGMLAALPPLSIDISQPTLLTIQTQFGAAAATVGLTLTLFMLGFALGQFGAGPLSDRHGRRPVLLMALLGYIAAALGCSTAGSAEGLVFWRFFQGVAAGSCAVLAFAIIRDLFDGEEARSKRSYVTVVFSLAPMLAPTFGAWVLEAVGWRPIFIILAAGGLVLLMAVSLGVAESRQPDIVLTPRRRLIAAYGCALRNRRFVGLAAVNALSYGGIFAYIAGSPQVLMGSLSLSTRGYGVFFACTALALTLGAWTNGRAAGAGTGPRRLLWLALTVAAGSALLLTGLLWANLISIATLLPLLALHLFCRGLIAPNAQHLALEPMRDQAGTASSVVGVMQILTGALASAVVALLLPSFGPAGMALVMTILSFSSLTLWALMARPPAA